MTWADKTIANPMGYARAVLFTQARDALRVYGKVTGALIKLPVCICPQVAALAHEFLEVDCTGMAPGTQMYGYRMEHTEDLDLDPMMTGWFREPSSPHRIVSLGRHKILPLTGGGVFCTNNLELADELANHSYFPGGDLYQQKVQTVFTRVDEIVYSRFTLIDMWDRYLGDMLPRVEREQVMPWRVMRKCPAGKRPDVIKALRLAGIAVNVHYQPYFGAPHHFPEANRWAEQVINFPIGAGLQNVGEDQYERYVFRACQTIYGTLNAGHS